MNKNLLLTNRKSLERKVMWVRWVFSPLLCSFWTKCVRELSDCENSFSSQTNNFCCRDSAQQSQIVFFESLSTTSIFELAMRAVLVQHQRRRLARLAHSDQSAKKL